MGCIWVYIAATQCEKAALQTIHKWLHASSEQCNTMAIAIEVIVLLQLPTFLKNCGNVECIAALRPSDLFQCFAAPQCFFDIIHF